MATETNRPAPVDPETQPTPAGVAADLEEEIRTSAATTEPRDVNDVPQPDPPADEVGDSESGD
jgi:hypothetical protein